jgi:ribosome-associated protein
MGAMRSEENPETPSQDLDQASKSARKREATALQELGVQLAGLPDSEIAQLDLPETLVGALKALRRLSSRGAQVRQRQYIGKLMRTIDPEPVLARLAEKKQRHDSEIRHFQSIERWRERLLAEPETASQELLREYPRANAGQLAKLLHKIERETLERRSPAGARELFAWLRELMAPGAI